MSDKQLSRLSSQQNSWLENVHL